MRINVAALLFDIDGTLVESIDTAEQVWRARAGTRGIDANEILAVCHGRRSEDTLAEFLPATRCPMPSLSSKLSNTLTRAKFQRCRERAPYAHNLMLKFTSAGQRSRQAAATSHTAQQLCDAAAGFAASLGIDRDEFTTRFAVVRDLEECEFALDPALIRVATG